jgi:5-(carboxyamino)imidazole ribonucleotide synthase
MINKRLGILGGGQLGKMTCLAASEIAMSVSIMDHNRDDSPAGNLCTSFVAGDITNYADVMSFGNSVDILSIEIEKVNVKALYDLHEQGKTINPSPGIISLIQDKSLQKSFLIDNNLPTSEFVKVSDKVELMDRFNSGNIKFPFVQKLCKDGYDGRGVLICRKFADMNEAFDAPCIIENLVDIDHELAVIVCRNKFRQTAIYDVVEMVFDPNANLLDFQIAPATLDTFQTLKIQKMAYEIAEAIDLIGILAIELFMTKSGEILVNEMAPRPHNSGHHTIEACQTSQYENFLRSITGLPLGSPETLSSSLLVNLLGSQDYQGPVNYSGVERILSIPNTHLHIYGKPTSKPFRKMGHVNVLNPAKNKEIEYLNEIKSSFKTYK